MTGFGDARAQDQRLSVAVEIRSVNNRYLKVQSRLPDTYASLEAEIEKVVRQSISRGTVSVTCRADSLVADSRYVISREVLQSYWRQLSQVSESMHLGSSPALEALLPLPGVIVETNRQAGDPQEDWPLVAAALEEALKKLGEFRAAEGRSMEQELRANAATIAARLGDIGQLVPQVLIDFRDRLLERVRELLQGTGASVEPADLIREVSIFSERADINEEITRLRSHLEQFESFLNEPVSAGRKLEFLSQEMFREVNTIGSKANNVTIAHAVVEMKAAVEKMREILQNVE